MRISYLLLPLWVAFVLSGCSKQIPVVNLPNVITVDKDKRITINLTDKDSVFKAEIDRDMVFFTVYKPQTLFDIIEESGSNI